MAFSNLGSHNVLGPCDWHWAALSVKFCASMLLLVLRISWCSYSLPGIPVLYFHVGHRLTSLLLSLSPTIPTWWPCIWEKAAWSFWLHSVSKIPASSACIPQPPLILSTAQLSSVELVFISLEILPWMVCHRLPLKSFLLLSSNNDGAKSHPKLTPYWLFPQYFTENTKQKCHFTRGVFFFSFRM